MLHHRLSCYHCGCGLAVLMTGLCSTSADASVGRRRSRRGGRRGSRGADLALLFVSNARVFELPWCQVSLPLLHSSFLFGCKTSESPHPLSPPTPTPLQPCLRRRPPQWTHWPGKSLFLLPSGVGRRQRSLQRVSICAGILIRSAWYIYIYKEKKKRESFTCLHSHFFHLDFVNKTCPFCESGSHRRKLLVTNGVIIASFGTAFRC